MIAMISISGHAQINDCFFAQVVCSDADLEFNPVGPGHDDYADPDNEEGCIVALEQNSAWFYFEIDPLAPPNLELGFIISPNGGFGEDYDWALYGPDVDCGDLGFPIRCSSSSAQCDFCPETGMGMNAMDTSEGPGTGDGFVMTLTVQPGQGFYLMIDNWLGTMDGFMLSWTGTAAPYLNCAADPPCFLEALAGSNIDACEGDQGVLLDGGNLGGQGDEIYEWSGTGDGTSYLDNPNIEDPVINFPPDFTGTITYTLTVTEDDCMDEDEVIVTVHPLPIVSIEPVDPLCENGSPQMLIGSPPGGVWGGDATGNMFNPMLHGPGTHTVTYAYTSSDNCTATAFMDIEVNVSPDVVIDPDPAGFCDSESFVLLTATADNGAPDYEYSWNGPAGMGDQQSYEANLSGQYTVTVTDANGCTNTAVTTVTSYANPDVEIIDPGPICANVDFYTLMANPPGGIFSGTIVGPSGDMNPSMNPPGTYTIWYEYSDMNDCPGMDVIDIQIVEIPDATASNNGSLCAGETLLLFGETTATGTSISYIWTGPNGYMSTMQNPTDATEGGAYYLEVVVDGCSSEIALTDVIVGTTPDVQATNDGPYCNGQNIQLFGSTNTPGTTFEYNWSGPNGYVSSVQNPADATEPGIYQLIILVDGCPSAPVVTEVVFSDPPDANATNTGPYCMGEAIELLGSTTTSGTMISYVWNGPNGYQSGVQNPTDATTSGTYKLVINVDGCDSDTVMTDVIVNAVPQPMIIGQDSFCTGFSAIIDAGAGYMNYLWDDASSNQTLEVFSSGWHYVTVTDVNGCTGIDSIEVTELASLMPQITGTLDFCEGGNTVLDGGAGYVGYNWSTSETTQTITVSTAETFFLTVTDSDGCTGSTSINTTINPNPVVMIGGSTTFCIGGYSILDAGAGYTDYLWSNDSTTQEITVDMPGSYTVSVVDSNGCMGQGDVTVTESTSLSPVITGGNAFCENGNVTLNAGTGFANYIWSNGAITQNLFVDVAGTYTVTVSDNQGCSGSSSVTVIEVMPPSATVQGTASLCNTTAGGSLINLFDLVTGGDMNGNWMDADNSGASGQFTNLDFNGVVAGDYRFVYTTNSAIAPCPEESYDVIITVIDCTCPDVFFFSADPLCNRGDVLDLTSIENTTEDGTWALVTTPPGSNPAVLNGTNFDATSGDPGEYELSFTLTNQPPPGCPITFSVLVNVDQQVNAGVADPPLSFCANADQLIDLSTMLSGADPNGTWSETSSTPSQGGAFDALAGTFRTLDQAPGTYTFEYRLMANGACPEDATEVSVVLYPVPVVLIAAPLEFNCSQVIQTLDASGSTSDPGDNISWTGPGIVIDGNENSLMPTIDEPGVYQLTILNSVSGCADSASVTVVANTDRPTEVALLGQNPACFGDENGLIQIESVTGGASPFLYSLNGGALSSDNLFSDLPPGEYMITVEDANGCLLDTTVTLDAPEEISIDLGSDIELDLGDEGMFQLTITPASLPVDTIVWTPDNIVECLDVNCENGLIHAFNTVTLTATLYDAFGCSTSDQILVTVDRSRKMFIPNVISPNGDGVNDVFYVAAKENQIASIRNFSIFSRWGEVVYEATDIQPNDINDGWDGRYDGEQINPGVYVYVAEIEFFDGVTEVYTGDVTVLR